tara:strand:+ start:5181 stop:5372 length:192 start_codon:yes stop_codon:yes gene_type:complete
MTEEQEAALKQHNHAIMFLHAKIAHMDKTNDTLAEQQQLTAEAIRVLHAKIARLEKTNDTLAE